MKRQRKYTYDWYQHIAELVGNGCAEETVERFVFAEYDRPDRQNVWLNTATDEGIADWITTCLK